MKHRNAEETIRRILARQENPAATECPDANEMAAYLEKQLNPQEEARFEEHAAGCDACREALALALNIGELEGSAGARPVPAPTRVSYRLSPLRFAFAAVLLATVGVVLYQSTKQSPLSESRQQVARNEIHGSVAGRTDAAIRSKAGDISRSEPGISAANAPPSTPSGAPTRKEPAKPLERQAADTSIAAAPRPAPTQIAGAQPQVPVSAPAEAKSLDAVIAEQKKPGQADAATAKTVAAANETKNVTQAAQIVNAQVANNQIANLQPSNAQAVQLQAANAQQIANLQSAQTAGGRGGVGGQARDRALALPAAERLLDQESESANLKRVVDQALAEVRPLVTKSEAAANAKKIGNRVFYRTANFWVDAASAVHSEAPVRAIARGSREFSDLLEKDQSLTSLPAETGTPVLLYLNGTNCLLR